MAESPNKKVESVTSVEVLAAGKKTPDTLLVRAVHTENHVGRIPEATVLLASGDLAKQTYPETDSDSFEPGADLEIKLGYAGKNETVFKGIIVSKRLKTDVENGIAMEIRARDKAIAMAYVPITQFFEKKKDSDVIKAVIGDVSGLTPKVTATSQERDQIQNYMTGWRFIRLLADRNGHVVAIDSGTITVGPPKYEGSPKLAVTLGEDIREFDVQSDAEPLMAKAKTGAWSSIKLEREEAEGGKMPDLGWGSQKMAKLTQVTGDRTYTFNGVYILDVAN